MNKLEIHYYLENNIHSMDAFIKNKAEAELLKIFKEVSESLSLDLSFEIEALKSGGIREFLIDSDFKQAVDNKEVHFTSF